jgi:hypothetical protein
MASNEIDLERLRTAANDILDHWSTILRFNLVPVDAAEDFYWNYSFSEAYDSSKRPEEPEVGRLTDDVDFVR